jgi:alkylated DNA repair dioxygenase AlkB
MIDNAKRWTNVHRFFCKLYPANTFYVYMDQLNFFNEFQQAREIHTDIFDYKPELFNKSESQYYLDTFINSTPWSQTSLLIYGKKVTTPRLTAWFGNQISGSFLLPWTADLLTIKSKVEPLAGVPFDYVLLNYYRDGNDSVSWHDDEDRVPGKNKIVVSVSFGQERQFDIRNKKEHSDKYTVLLENGSYILMKGKFQSEWQHRIAKSVRMMGPRINLTFRQSY